MTAIAQVAKAILVLMVGSVAFGTPDDTGNGSANKKPRGVSGGANLSFFYKRGNCEFGVRYRNVVVFIVIILLASGILYLTV